VFNGSIVGTDILNIVTELGASVRHLRPTPGTYDGSKTYQSLTELTYTIDEYVSAVWSLQDSALVLSEWGLIKPDSISILVASTVDVIEDDLIVYNNKLYAVVHTKEIAIQGTIVGRTAELSEKVGTVVS
jgi:hypothetical protein